MRPYEKLESDAILEQIAKIALNQNAELPIDVMLEICYATPNFMVAISKLLGVYIRPTYESTKIIKRNNLQIEAIAYDFDDFNNCVHYRYKNYKVGNYLTSETDKELVIKTDYCSLDVWENLETRTALSVIDIAW